MISDATHRARSLQLRQAEAQALGVSLQKVPTTAQGEQTRPATGDRFEAADGSTPRVAATRFFDWLRQAISAKSPPTQLHREIAEVRQAFDTIDPIGWPSERAAGLLKLRAALERLPEGVRESLVPKLHVSQLTDQAVAALSTDVSRTREALAAHVAALEPKVADLSEPITAAFASIASALKGSEALPADALRQLAGQLEAVLPKIVPPHPAAAAGNLFAVRALAKTGGTVPDAFAMPDLRGLAASLRTLANGMDSLAALGGGAVEHAGPAPGGPARASARVGGAELLAELYDQAVRSAEAGDIFGMKSSLRQYSDVASRENLLMKPVEAIERTGYENALMLATRRADLATTPEERVQHLDEATSTAVKLGRDVQPLKFDRAQAQFAVAEGNRNLEGMASALWGMFRQVTGRDLHANPTLTKADEARAQETLAAGLRFLEGYGNKLDSDSRLKLSPADVERATRDVTILARALAVQGNSAAPAAFQKLAELKKLIVHRLWDQISTGSTTSATKSFVDELIRETGFVKPDARTRS
jgi:hypothetical protein